MERFANMTTLAGGALFGAAFFVKNFFFTVDAGHRGIVFDRFFDGVKPTIYDEGVHFIIPFQQSPIIFETRSKPKTVTSMTGSKDLQTVDVALRVLYRPMAELLPNIYNSYGLNYDERILPSIVTEVLKAEIAKYDAVQLLAQREKISAEIKDEVERRCKEFGIMMDDVALIHLGFGKEFSNAIEYKQAAQQQAERQKFIVQENEEKKRAAIIRSEGEAEAAKLIAEAVLKYGDALVEVKRMDTAKQIVENMTKNPNITYIPSNTMNLLNLKGV